jgi:hypothetical protein
MIRVRRVRRLLRARQRRDFCILLIGAAVLPALAGLTIGHLARPSGTIEPALVLLLRLMALIKLGIGLGAAWLVGWRLRPDCTAPLAVGYLIAVALMAAAPGLIWFMNDFALAAGLFHAGFLLALVLAYRDGVRG